MIKTISWCLLLGCGLAACKVAGTANTPGVVLRTVHVKELIPEGIAVDPETGVIYLSSLHQNKIVRVDAKGAVTDLFASGTGGFMWGLGMKFSGDTLWACSGDGNGRTALFAVDLQSGKFHRRLSHDSARFLNDLVIAADGRIFITDTQRGGVFIVEDGQLSPWLEHEQLKWANGIALSGDEKYLFVASGRYGVQKIDIDRKAISSTTMDKRVDYAIDGLVFSGNKLYAAIGWPQDRTSEHRILRYHLDGAGEFLRADTLAFNQPWLSCITTLAVAGNQLFALGNTNLGIYNRHQQQLGKIRDSLANPVVSKYPLP